ncbi:hypothetical protein BHE74_00007607 [Ensete ventricosum]|nr:hypothetical protein BHE74_00007607 [Ensete ventricosum]
MYRSVWVICIGLPADRYVDRLLPGDTARRNQLREEERRRGRRKPGVLFTHVIRSLRAISSPCMGRRNASQRGEKE